MLCYVMLCYVMLCYVMLCYVMLCYVMLCYVMLCYVMLCYVMLCYVMLCHVIVPIFKKKDKLYCANYRGINLLSLVGKVSCSIIHSRTKKKTEEILSESQTGFRPDRGTADQLFSLRQITEKYNEIGKPLYLCYICFQKVFDTVWQEGLWAAMRHLSYPDKIVRHLHALYQISTSAVRVDDDITEWFRTLTGKAASYRHSFSTFCWN